MASKYATEKWVLRLYVAGNTPAARTALASIEKICAHHLKGRYSLEVIDLLIQPDRAADDQILAVPTLVRKLPLPMRKVIGDLVETESVLMGLEIQQGVGPKQAGRPQRSRPANPRD